MPETSLGMNMQINPWCKDEFLIDLRVIFLIRKNYLLQSNYIYFDFEKVHFIQVTYLKI